MRKIKRKLIGFVAGERGSIGKLQGLALGVTGILASGLLAKHADAGGGWSSDAWGYVDPGNYQDYGSSDFDNTWPNWPSDVWLANWPTDWSGNWLNDWPIDWPSNWTFANWLNDWPTNWLSNWPTNWPTDWTANWTSNWPSNWPVNWPVNWPSNWSGDWPSNWPTNWPANAAPSVDQTKAQ